MKGSSSKQQSGEQSGSTFEVSADALRLLEVLLEASGGLAHTFQVRNIEARKRHVCLHPMSLF